MQRTSLANLARRFAWIFVAGVGLRIFAGLLHWSSESPPEEIPPSQFRWNSERHGLEYLGQKALYEAKVSISGVSADRKLKVVVGGVGKEIKVEMETNWSQELALPDLRPGMILPIPKGVTDIKGRGSAKDGQGKEIRIRIEDRMSFFDLTPTQRAAWDEALREAGLYVPSASSQEKTYLEREADKVVLPVIDP